MNASHLIYTALSPLVSGQVYPYFIPETADDTPPYVIYQIISTMPITTLDGITHHERVRMQLDAYHSDYDELLRLYGEILDSDDGLYRASIDVLFNHTAK